MPTLGDLNCSIELGRRNTLIREYGIFYGNKTVSCYICAPPHDINFSIHVTSSGSRGFTAAPGLAMFVFIDGQYQCNRNLTNIEEQNGIVDLRVRQKEEPTEGHQFIGRDWSCSALKTGSVSKATRVNPDFLTNLGTIEVVILRCKSSAHTRGPASRTDVNDNTIKTASKAMSVRNVDTSLSKAGKTTSKAAASIRPKTASAPGSELGGLFGGFGLGLFDGADDYDDRQSSRRGFERTLYDRSVAPQSIHYHFNFGRGHTKEDVDAAVRLVQVQARSSSSRQSRGRSGYHEHHRFSRSRDHHRSKERQISHPAWSVEGDSHHRKQDDEDWGQERKSASNAGTALNDWFEPDDGQNRPGMVSGGCNDWFTNDNDIKSSSKSSSVKAASKAGWDTQSKVPGEWNGGGDGGWDDEKPKSNKSKKDGWEKVGSGVKHAEGNGWGDTKKSEDKAKIKGFEKVGSEINRAEAERHHGKHDGAHDVQPLCENTRPIPFQSYVQTPITKPYWSNPGAAHKGYGEVPPTVGASTTGPTFGLRDPYVAPAYDLPVVCAEYAAADGLEVQVKTGRGARYIHEVGQPVYLDTMHDPHAVFVFRYRTKEVLEKMLHTELPEDMESSKARVRSMSRDELEKAYLRSREKASGSSSKKHSARHSSRQPTSSSKTIAVEKKVSEWNDGNKAASANNGWAAKASSKKENEAWGATGGSKEGEQDVQW